MRQAFVWVSCLLVAIGALIVYRTCDPFDVASFVIKSAQELELMFLNAPGTDDGLPVDRLHTFDFIVIGAGSAGCAIASRLSENPAWSVLLIEAGPSESVLMDVPVFTMNSQRSSTINWKYQTEASAHGDYCAATVDGRCQWPRGKVMGGSSVLNFMVYTRGLPSDYDRWSELGNDGWSFSEIERYFESIENMQVPNEPLRNGSGLMTISLAKHHTQIGKTYLQAAQDAGLPLINYNSAPKAGTGRAQLTTENGRRVSSNRAYIMPFLHRTNLHTRTRTLVTRILIDPLSKQAVGVEMLVDGRTERAYVSKEVVLSAGAIASPQLLMLSGIGEQSHLESLGIEMIINNPNVGANLMDHIAPEVLHIITNTSDHVLYDLFKPQTWLSYIQTGDSIIGIAGGCETVSFLSDQPNGEQPDIEILQISGGFHQCRDVEVLTGYRSEIFHQSYTALKRLNHDIFTLIVFPLRPKSRGRIRLRTANAVDHPLIEPNYYAHPYDMEVTLRGMRTVMRLLDTPTMRGINATLADTTVPECRRFVWLSDAFWRCQARHLTYSIFHYSGTCKMGVDGMEVVDPRLRVRGVHGLRVADASIMPEIVSGHTNAAVLMVAEKAADMLRNDWILKSSL